jgi:hypothetical protein
MIIKYYNSLNSILYLYLVFNNNLFILCVSDKYIYIENFLSNDRKYYYIDNINPPRKGCILYNNKIIISSINGYIYIKYT